MAANRRAWLKELLRVQGAPYVWGGHGSMVWGPSGLHMSKWPFDVFDCAGLVTTTLFRADGPDWRATHNAQTLWDVSTPVSKEHAGRALQLLFYGVGTRIEHVRVIIGCAECESTPLVIEAAGGGRGTLVPQRDALGPARVIVRALAPEAYDRRDFVGERELPPEALSPLY